MSRQIEIRRCLTCSRELDIGAHALKIRCSDCAYDRVLARTRKQTKLKRKCAKRICRFCGAVIQGRGNFFCDSQCKDANYMLRRGYFDSF